MFKQSAERKIRYLFSDISKNISTDFFEESSDNLLIILRTLW